VHSHGGVRVFWRGYVESTASYDERTAE
jgi:hypothetical protein